MGHIIILVIHQSRVRIMSPSWVCFFFSSKSGEDDVILVVLFLFNANVCLFPILDIRSLLQLNPYHLLYQLFFTVDDDRNFISRKHMIHVTKGTATRSVRGSSGGKNRSPDQSPARIERHRIWNSSLPITIPIAGHVHHSLRCPSKF